MGGATFHSPETQGDLTLTAPRTTTRTGDKSLLVSDDLGLTLSSAGLKKDAVLHTVHVGERPSGGNKGVHFIEDRSDTSSRIGRQGSREELKRPAKGIIVYSDSSRIATVIEANADDREKGKAAASSTEADKEVIDLGSDTEEEAEEDERRCRWNPTTSEDRAMKPFYLTRVPPTKVGRLFQEYERRYWKARQKGLAGLGKGRRFFDTKNEPDLTKEECDEFRALAKRFTTRVSEKSPGKIQDRIEHQVKHQGRVDEATEEALRATQRRAQRYYLIRRLNKVLAGLAAATDKNDDDAKKRKFEVKWLDNHSKMLQGIVAEEPLHAEDPLIQLYKQWLAIKQVPSCIQLPS